MTMTAFDFKSFWNYSLYLLTKEWLLLTQEVHSSWWRCYEVKDLQVLTEDLITIRSLYLVHFFFFPMILYLLIPMFS